MTAAERRPEALPDAAARRAIAEDLGVSMLVEAAAGTGKTTSLVERMTALIAAGTRIDRISAVTFTIKAAAELSERFQVRLEKAARAARAPYRMRFDDALARLDSAFVGTIHAFCARLLRERPVEAGVDPGFSEMDEPEDAARRQEAWGRYVERLFTEESPLLARLAELHIRLEDLEQTFDSLCENEDVAPAIGPEAPPPDFSSERAAVEEFLAKAQKELPREAPARGWSEYQEAIRRGLRLAALAHSDDSAGFARVLEALGRARKKGNEAGPLRPLWERLCRDAIEPGLKRWREYLHPILMRAVAPAIQDYSDWRRRNGRLNFQDLLLLARDLLRDHPSVRRAFQQRFLPVLVDEFQDTDPIQAEILFYLTGKDTEEKDWRALMPLPGSLFVVGDPKQSIYRFRRADIETYRLVRDRLSECGRLVHLTSNFRSIANLCDWVNEAFPPLFAAPARGQADWVALSPRRPSGPPAVFRLVTRMPTTATDPLIAHDAGRIAETIASAVRCGERRPGDFLLLFRMRSRMPDYARALEARGISYELSGGGAFSDSEELRTLLPLLSSISDPDDPVSFVAVLRGPLFGVDDEALYRFARAGGRFSFQQPLPENADPRIAGAVDVLVEARAMAETLPPGAAISRICGRIGWTAYAGARELGDSRAGNLLKAIAAARTFSSEGLDFAAVVGELRRLTGEGYIEEMSVEPGRRDAVRLSTVHGAKGLQAPVVFLADPRRDRDKPPRVWIDRTGLAAAGHWRVLRETDGFGVVELAEPAGWDAMEESECAFAEAEKARLLYVAATRAREMLVVSLFKQGRSENAQGAWHALAPTLTEDLPEAPAAPPAEAAPPLRRLPVELSAFRADQRARRARSASVSTAALPVTELVHAVSQKPAWEWTGRGMSFGRVLHRMLEALMRDEGLDVRAHAANLLAEEERPAAELEDVMRLVEAVARSPLWQRARAARRRLVEVPFALDVAREEVGLADGPARRVLQGAIDLLFEEEEGWVLVDYKSDTIVPGALEGLVAFYAPQVALYRRYWERLTGRPTRAGLFFVQTGETFWLPG